MSTLRFNHRNHRTSRVVLLAGLMVLAANPAFAADGWEQPMVKLLETVSSGTGKIVVSVLGLGLMAYGAYSAFTGEFNIKKLAGMVIGGAICVAAPHMASLILGAIT